MDLQVREIESSEIYKLIINNQQILCRQFSHSQEIPREVIIEDLYKTLTRNYNSSSALHLGLFDSNGKVFGGVSLHASEWDTCHFGIKIGKSDFLLFDSTIELHDRLILFQELKQKLLDMGFQVVFFRHFLDDTKSIIALSKIGGVLADVLLTFHKSVKDLISSDHRNLSIKIRNAYQTDGVAICNLARTSFHVSHFHSDPNLPRSLSDELFAKWSLNSLGESSNKVFVAEENDAICGFLTFKVKKLPRCISYGVLDLMAVSSEKQNRGVGKLLFAEALKWLSSRTSSVYSGTQAANIPAVRVHESAGFRLVESEATLHLWVS